MPRKHWTFGIVATLLVTGCSQHSIQPGTYVAAPAASDADDVVDDGEGLRVVSRARRHSDAHFAISAAIYTEPMTALRASERWRATWKSQSIDYERLIPAFSRLANDPHTTSSLKDEDRPRVPEGPDAQAAMDRLFERGKKAAAPICQGC